MKLPNFLCNIFYVRPFIKMANISAKKDLSIFHVYSDNKQNLFIYLIIGNKMLELIKEKSKPQVANKFELNEHSLNSWDNKVEKILLLKASGELNLASEVLEKITNQININKRYADIYSNEVRDIYKEVIYFQRDYYTNNVMDINTKIVPGLQNHWLD